jgi:quercetin dioxygenase-like cupin family protein
MSHHDTLTATVRLDSHGTAGVLSVVEITVPPRWDGPPLHYHDFDETFHVLEGDLTFLLGDELRGAPAGSTIFARRGAHHTLANVAAAAARYLLICTPGGFERMFVRLAARKVGVDPPPAALEPYPETVVVGPTVFEHLGMTP